MILSDKKLVYTDFEGRIGILDNESNKLWEERLGAHHDADIKEGNLITFITNTNYSKVLQRNISDELITTLNISNGEIINQFSLEKAINKKYNLTKKVEEEHQTQLGRFYSTPTTHNIFHANSIKTLRKDYNEIFTKGRVLISIRNINSIALLDLEEETVVWMWGSEVLDYPHHPTPTKEGNILIYDNGLINRDYTRIIEVDPISEEIVWSFNFDGEVEFHSNIMGSVQELPNNNILILESITGRVIEVDRKGNILYEKKYEEPISIYRCEKFTRECIEGVFSSKYESNRDCK